MANSHFFSNFFELFSLRPFRSARRAGAGPVEMHATDWRCEVRGLFAPVARGIMVRNFQAEGLQHFF